MTRARVRLFVAAVLILAAGSALAAQWLPLFANPYATAYFAQITTNGCATPTAAWKAAVGRAATALQTSGVLKDLDWLYFLGAADACTATINFLNAPQTPLSVNGACSFTAYQGYAGDGSSCYLATPANMTTLTNFAQNNGHLGVFGKTTATNQGTFLGAQTTADQLISDGNVSRSSRINVATNVSDTVGSISTIYYESADRLSSATLNTYRNGASLTTGAASTSAAVVAQVQTILRSVTTYGNGSVCEADTGGALTTAQETALYNALAALCGTGTAPH